MFERWILEFNFNNTSNYNHSRGSDLLAASIEQINLNVLSMDMKWDFSFSEQLYG